jgi:hypothetical protein
MSASRGSGIASRAQGCTTITRSQAKPVLDCHLRKAGLIRILGPKVGAVLRVSVALLRDGVIKRSEPYLGLIRMQIDFRALVNFAEWNNPVE